MLHIILCACWLLACPLFFWSFLGPHLGHMEVPRLGFKSELQLLAYTTATAASGSEPCLNLHHSSQQRWIPDPLSKAGDRTRNLMVPSQIHFHCASEFPLWLSGLRTQLVSMRTQAQSLASVSGLRIWHSCELRCRLQMQLRSCVAVALA